ncbi:MAG: hypothetical protein Q8O79_04020 [Pseudomonadota bacterium]|nr:hypothetical protein [Pseudomonadota bacterium]
MTCTLLLGLGIALLGGGVAAWVFSAITVFLLKLPPKSASSVKRIPPWLTGLVERSFFVVLVATRVEGVPEAMIGWLAIKLAVNWQKLDPDKNPDAQTRGLLALLSGAISLVCAYVGGAIISGVIYVGT